MTDLRTPPRLQGSVLVVDDSAVYRGAIAMTLRKAGGTVTEAAGGAAALKSLETARYDVVVTDLQMPDVDGFAVLESARARDREVEILVLTAAYGENSAAIVRALRLGANDYLDKANVGPEQIVSGVDRALERRRHRRELGAAEARYRELLERVQAVVWRAQVPSMRFTFVSPEAEKLLGYPTSAWLADPDFWKAHLHPDDREQTVARCLQLAEDRQDQELEYRMAASNGWTVWVQDSVRVVSADGQPAELVGVMIDITRRKLLEEELRQAQKMEAFGQLAGGVAHDFNNILGVVLASSDLVLKDIAPADPRRDRVEEIRRAAERGAALTRQLLAFSRRQVLQPRVLDLADVVSGIAPMLRRLIGEHIELETVSGDPHQSVYADPGQIEQIVLNLVLNGRDAMPAGGRLVIATSQEELGEGYASVHAGVRPGSYVLLSVSDTGTGIDRETIARIFEPFFTTKEPGKGTGLGLATVYGIVQQNGGHVAVYSEPGRGSTFRVYFPTAVASEAPGAAGPASRQRRAVPLRGQETILVVEDDDAVREVTGDVLQTAGYTVLEAARPAQAIALATSKSSKIDLLLTDIVMPEMSGTALAKQFLTLSSPTRVLFMSGYPAQVVSRQELMEPGTPFIEKPFSSETLLRTVREALDRPRAEIPSPFARKPPRSPKRVQRRRAA